MIRIEWGGRLVRQGWLTLHATCLCAVGLIFPSGCAEPVRVNNGSECPIEDEEQPGEDDCNSCSCQGGHWLCTQKDCADSCEEGEMKQEDCNTCACQEGEWLCTRKACLPETCEDGETKPSDDSCNTCTCFEGGWACTEKACGDVCVEGETRAEDCNVCLCSDGQWACTAKGCPDLCHDGDAKLAEDGCNTCTCSAGVWGCTERACEPICKDGEISGGCGECTCMGGQWACTDVACPMPPDCEAGDTKDDGCNTCSCDANGRWLCTLIECEVSCGGLGGVADCGDDQYCAYEAAQGGCGILDASSVCKPRPEECAAVDEPVCGCNGMTYSSSCEAARDGWGVMSSGECGPLP